METNQLAELAEALKPAVQESTIQTLEQRWSDIKDQYGGNIDASKQAGIKLLNELKSKITYLPGFDNKEVERILTALGIDKLVGDSAFEYLSKTINDLQSTAPVEFELKFLEVFNALLNARNTAIKLIDVALPIMKPDTINGEEEGILEITFN